MIRLNDPWMLLFAAAAVVPAIIAWLARRRAVPRRWAAMEILAAAARRGAFHGWLAERLPTAMRIAMLLLVAFAAARPLVVPSPRNPDEPKGDGPGRGRRVLVVGNDDAVASAIEAASSGAASVRSIREEAMDAESFEPSHDDAPSLVVLGDGVAPQAGLARRLERFVDSGGAVVVLVGPRSTGGRSSAAVARFVAGLAGVEIGPVVDETHEAGADGARRGKRIVLSAATSGASPMELPGATVARRAMLRADRDPPGRVGHDRLPPVILARTASGGPLAIAVRVGRGTVGVVAVPLALEGWNTAGWAAHAHDAGLQPSWTDLPAWPAFIPFVERTILAPGSDVDRRPPDAGRSRIGTWLARTNLSGLALFAALVLAAADPLIPLLASRRSRVA